MACNFQFASISHEWISARTIKFTIESQWRRNYTTSPCNSTVSTIAQVWGLWSMLARAGPGDTVDVVGVTFLPGSSMTISFNPGDGTLYPLRLEVSELSETENFIHGFSYIYHTFASTDTIPQNLVATLRGCCWQAAGGANASTSASAIAALNTGGQFSISARLSVRNPKPSLVVRALPLQHVASEGITKIFIPASTPSGIPATYYRKGQGSVELGDVNMSSPAIYFSGADYLRGVLSVNGGALKAGAEYPAVVMLASEASNYALVPYAFSVRVQPPARWAAKPFFLGTPLNTNVADGAQALDPSGELPLLHGHAGYELFVTLVAGTLRAGRQVDLIRSLSLPEGAYLSNPRGAGAPGNSTLSVDFRWTPSGSQVSLAHSGSGHLASPPRAGTHAGMLRIFAGALWH